MCRIQWDEQITASFQGDVILFECKHMEGSRPEELTQPLRMPFMLSADMVSASQVGNSIVLSVKKQSASRDGEVEIPIHS